MKGRSGWILLASVAVLGGLIGSIFWAATTARWHVSASQPRPSPGYDWLRKKALADPQVPAGWHESFTVRTNGEWIEALWPDTSVNAHERHGFVPMDVPASQEIRLSSGVVRLETVGVAYGRIPEDQLDEHSYRMPARFFNSALDPLSDAEARALIPEERNRQLDFRGMFPEAVFVFSMDGIQEAKLMGVTLFDARTRQPLSSGHGSSLHEGRLRLTTSVGAWHATALELSLDLAHGESIVTNVVPQTGAVIRCAAGELYLAAVLHGAEHRGWSTSSHNGTNTFRMAQGSSDDANTSSFMFVGYPNSSALPLLFEFLDREGERLPEGGSGSSGFSAVFHVRAPLAEVATIRVRELPRRTRLIFSLPRLPGLPEENEAAENLFQVRIPELRMRENWDFTQVLERSLQVQMDRRIVPQFPNGSFPRKYENVTPEDLLEIYMQALPQPRQAAYDPAKNQIVMRGPWYEETWQRLRTFLRLR